MDKTVLTPKPVQARASEWHAQWSMFEDGEEFLFTDWIRPATLDDFGNKDVLECGCGGGQHTSMIARVARSVTAVDLNTTDIARAHNAAHGNATFVQGDIVTMNLHTQYDVVLCVGVIHHTNDPDAAFENMYRHCKPGGTIIIWTYSEEGNALVRLLVEPLRKAFLRVLSRRVLVVIATMVTAFLYPLVYSLYLVPWFSALPYYEYFGNFRKLSFWRNVLNVFDKLNAPQTRFTSLARCRQWFNPTRFVEDSISIRPYKGVSYSLVGQKRDG